MLCPSENVKAPISIQKYCFSFHTEKFFPYEHLPQGKTDNTDYYFDSFETPAWGKESAELVEQSSNCGKTGVSKQTVAVGIY